MTLDIDHLRQWIGRKDHAHEVLTPTLVQRLYATLDRQGPTEEGADAPLLTHHCLCQPLVPTAELGPDGHPTRGGFLPPVPLPRRMWAGGALRFHSAPRIGEDITRRSVIEDVTMKSGRSGALCFVTLRHDFSSPHGPILSERQDIVYRDAPTGNANPAPTPAPQGDERREISASPAFLFRYSALTFNGHRIHYDQPYAREEEFYPGLVVHGPLQAMLLAQYAGDLMGRAPTGFSFRSMAPIFGGGSFCLHAQRQGDDLMLWTAAPDGPVAMEARASWD
ncbi:MaoC family dehydratase N-terminal domain-containing protein [Roseovarius sp. PS-C2]|uniref:FAS1-like dehydratase domain-containing protein n=1 Tax=Roseobacteraceae TaxID=2854170 RepID=UPI001C0CF227|nr:MaoC family dehydratase N-terminal domain-containing protein [Roseovarius sp. PS-C2]MBU3261871.1 MaoC family dehydratase N-terminal domain-containing protein [Roseovarius sp. PS-C2]